MTRTLSRARWCAAPVLLALVAALVLGTASPASAHAVLISSDPAEGSVLPEDPGQIRFTFSEPITQVPDGVTVYDAEGETVSSSADIVGTELDVELREKVAGTLVVVWRVVSADGHPVSGSLSFSVGTPSASVKPPPETSAAPTGAPVLLSVVRGLGYAGLLLAVGLVGFALLLMPTSHLANAGRVRLVAAGRVAAAVTVPAWLAALPLTMSYQLGGGLGSLGRASTWTSFPMAEYAVTAVVVLGVPLAVRLLGDDGLPTRSRARVALVAAALAAGAPALTGHTRAATPEILVIGADLVHLLAGSVWLGGLVALALVLPDLAGRGDLGAELLARFSGVGAAVLAVLVVTGPLLAWRIFGSWSALPDAGYGQVLLVKTAAALVVIALAAWNRFALLPRLRSASRRRERLAGANLVVRATVAEALVLVVVLGATGVLVDKSPQTRADLSADADTGPHSAMLGEFEVVAAVSPHVTGPNTVTIQIRNADGVPVEPPEPPRARIATDDIDLGAVELTSVAPGTFTGEVVLLAAGTWDLQVSLRTGEFDNPVTILEFPVFEAPE